MAVDQSSATSSARVFAGRFEYVKPLGKGAGGSVYLAEDLHNERRRVALKVLSAEAYESVQGKMLRREFEILSKLDHSHLVRVYDYGGLSEGGIYLAEEYIDGLSLQDARALLEPEALIDVTRQVLLGLSYLHGMGMIHRDVKPANVMLLWLDDASARPMVKLVDFGLSSMDPEEDTLRGGTRSYMAPEIIRGNQAQFRSDLFSLGVTLYYALAGVLPFGPRSKQDPPPTEEDIRPPPPHRYNDDVPLTLSRFTMVLLRQVEGVEYRDAGEALQALARDTSSYEWWSGQTLSNSLDVAAAPVLRGYFERGILGRRSKEHENIVDLLIDGDRDGASGMHLVSGEPGVGKSRLIREVAASLKLERRRVMTVTCEPEMHAWELVHQMLARIIELGESRDIHKIEHYRPYLRILERLSRLEQGATSSGVDGGSDDRAWMREAFHDSIILLHPERLVMVVEDLHQADAASLEFLSQWYGERGDLQTLDIVASARSGALPPEFVETERVVEHEITGLTRSDVVTFFGGRLGLADLDEEWIDKVSARADGQPAYLAELCRNLIDEGLLRRASVSSWELDREGLEGFSLPETLQASFRRRFASVGAAGREALEVMALMERPVRWEGLRTFIAPESGDSEAADRELQSLRMRYLAKLNVEPEARYLQLVDDKLADVVVEMMDRSWRRGLSRRIGDYLQKAWRDGEADPAEAGLHLEQGGREAEAATMYETAGDAAWLDGEFGDAYDQYRRAVEATDRGPSRAYQLVKLAQVFLALYETAKCRQCIEQAGEIAERTSLDWLMYTVFTSGARVSAAMGRPGEVRRWLTRLEDSLPSLSHQASVAELTAALEYRDGHLDKAGKLLAETINRAEHFGVQEGLVRCSGALAEVNYLTGESQKAVTQFERALSMASKLERRAPEGALLRRFGTSLRRGEELDQAANVLEASLEHLGQSGDPAEWIRALLELAVCHRLMGDMNAAGLYASDALVFARQLEHEALMWEVELAAAEVDWVKGGDRVGAGKRLRKAVEGLQRADASKPEVAEALIRTGDMLASANDTGAGQLIQRGQTMARDMGAELLLA
jgi:serine/threonine protein kinase/tetratricopeptide (TPR) repeat protein